MQTLSRRFLYVQDPESMLGRMHSSAHRLVLDLALDTQTPTAESAESTPLWECLVHLSSDQVVVGTLEAAEWAETCMGDRARVMTELASFWATSLHTVMARKACEDAEQVVKLGVNLPAFEFAPHYHPLHPKQVTATKACVACKNQLEAATAADIASRKWMRDFGLVSLHAAKDCEEVGWLELQTEKFVPNTYTPTTSLQAIRDKTIPNAVQHCHNAAKLAADVAKAAADHYVLQGRHNSRAPSPIEGDIARHLPPPAAALAMKDIWCMSHFIHNIPRGHTDPEADHDLVNRNGAPPYDLMTRMHEDGLGVGFRLWQLLRQMLELTL